MNKKTMDDVFADDLVKFIKLPFFLKALQFYLQNEKLNTTTRIVFSNLLDKGLKLRFSEPGYVNEGVKISNGDVKCKLRKLDDALINHKISNELFNQTIETESGLEIQLSDILIGRDNVKQLYSEMGLDTYPWVKALTCLDADVSVTPFTDKYIYCDFLLDDNKLIPLNTKDTEEYEKQIFKQGPPTMSLESFVDDLLVEAIGSKETLPTLFQLIKNYGLVVYDKVIEGNEVDSEKLVAALTNRQLQAPNPFSKDNFYFWETLKKERRYSVYRDGAAESYLNAEKSEFPWWNLSCELVWLNPIDFVAQAMPLDIEKQNAIAELASLRPDASKYHKIANDILVKPLPAMPEEPALEDRIMRFVWLHELEAEKIKVNKCEWSKEQDRKLDQINLKIKDIKQQLGYCGDENNISIAEDSDSQKQQTSTPSQKKKPDKRNSNAKVNSKFANFDKLHSREVSCMMADGRATITIRRKNIVVYPSDLGLKESQQGWILLVKTCMVNGDLSEALKTLNTTSDRERERRKIKTAVNRLKNKLKQSMGLQDDPIVCDPTYRFIFADMNHSEFGTKKGGDALRHQDNRGFEAVQHGHHEDPLHILSYGNRDFKNNIQEDDEEDMLDDNEYSNGLNFNDSDY